MRQQVAVAGGVRALPASASAAPGGDRLVRDPLLDRYMEEHRQRSRGAVMVMPAEDGIRQVDLTTR